MHYTFRAISFINSQYFKKRFVPLWTTLTIAVGQSHCCGELTCINCSSLAQLHQQHPAHSLSRKQQFRVIYPLTPGTNLAQFSRHLQTFLYSYTVTLSDVSAVTKTILYGFYKFLFYVFPAASLQYWFSCHALDNFSFARQPGLLSHYTSQACQYGSLFCFTPRPSPYANITPNNSQNLQTFTRRKFGLSVCRLWRQITWFRLNRLLKYLQLNSANRDAGRRLQI